MGSFGAISPRVKSRRGCNCCFASKPIDAPPGPCAGCTAAGCEYRAGNWFRGDGTSKDASGNPVPNGKPVCPARMRSRKAGNARALARKMVIGGNK